MSVVNPAGTFINGPDGKLEAKYVQGKSSTAPTVLILHPHPEYGGTMNNKVVYNAFHTFLKNGFSVCRFNFKNNCSRKERDMPCLIEISFRLTGFCCLLKVARSAIAITAYLPFAVSFIVN